MTAGRSSLATRASWSRKLLRAAEEVDRLVCLPGRADPQRVRGVPSGIYSCGIHGRFRRAIGHLVW